jgi:hypothetical protein
MMSFICSCRNKIGAELHIYLQEGTYHKRLFRGPSGVQLHPRNHGFWVSMRVAGRFPAALAVVPASLHPLYNTDDRCRWLLLHTLCAMHTAAESESAPIITVEPEKSAVVVRGGGQCEAHGATTPVCMCQAGSRWRRRRATAVSPRVDARRRGAAARHVKSAAAPPVGCVFITTGPSTKLFTLGGGGICGCGCPG